VLTFPLDELRVLFLAGNLTQLYFDGSSGDDALALWQKLLADDAFEEGTFAWMKGELPVDCEPTTAIMGRSISKLTSDLRMIS
jgi:hypothetical protein